VLILVDFKSSTINTSERRNGSETYGEFLKVLLEDSWRAKGWWSEQAGGRISRDAVRLQYTPHYSTDDNRMSIFIYELFE
jgi:hypothetical protein